MLRLSEILGWKNIVRSVNPDTERYQYSEYFYVIGASFQPILLNNSRRIYYKISQCTPIVPLIDIEGYRTVTSGNNSIYLSYRDLPIEECFILQGISCYQALYLRSTVGNINIHVAEIERT